MIDLCPETNGLYLQRAHCCYKGESSNISKAFLNDLRRTGPVTDDSGLDVFVAFCINCAHCI
jgi:hypothetical protein